MPTFELSLTKDYVPEWTVIDAVREIFQNALDQQTSVIDNTMFCNYAAGAEQYPGVLRIGNKSSVLKTSTLLLGSSTKRDDPNTIGQFGEGYKVGTLVLLRNGKKVTFYNYGAKEVWTTRFKNSKKYEAEILEFNVDKKYAWQSIPDDNLTIDIEGITADEYKAIVESNLHLQYDVSRLPTKYGDILLNPAHAGKVFVNGLFVCNYAPYTKGYDFKPKEIKLGRDRSLVDSFALRWLSSKMWSDNSNSEVVTMAAELVRSNARDVEFITEFNHVSPKATKSIADEVAKQFVQEHGPTAIPVSNNDELTKVPEGRKAVMTSESRKRLVEHGEFYTKPAEVVVESVRLRLLNWLTTHEQSLSRRAVSELTTLISEVIN